MEFSEKQKQAIVNYKYVGIDKSLYYKFFLSSFAQSCVDIFVPASVAPNTISILGLLCSTASALATLVLDPTLEGRAPSWVYFSTALTVLLYQTLDSMDGKQARKTGTSSSLGMYFDHLCDALNAVVTSISMASVLATGWSPKLFFFVLTGFVPFYVQTWEEYYTGALVLPAINGPNEGLLLISFFAVLAGIFGGSWYQQESDFLFNDFTLVVVGRKLCPFDVIFGVGYLMAFFTLIGNLIAVTRTVTSKGLSMWRPLADLTPVIAYTFGSLYWIINSDALSRHPLLSFLIVGLVHVETVSNILLAHIIKGDIRPNDRLLVWALMLLPLNTFMDDSLCDPSILTYTVFAIALAYNVLFINKTIASFAETLNTFVFKNGRRIQE